MSIKAKIRQTNRVNARVNQTSNIVAETVQISAAGLKLEDLANVDSTNIAEGALLVYNATTEQFETTNELSSENLTISAGLF
jgi:hypothetical protein